MAMASNTTKDANLAKVQDVDFSLRFGYSVKKLVEALGITRKIAKTAGTVLKVYKVTGELKDGSVAEGETIPLSEYKTTYEPIGEVRLAKFRKETTAEAISNKGYKQAVIDTDQKMLQDIQKGIRKTFFDYLAAGTGVASGVGLQAALAQAWGQLQVLFEDDTGGFSTPIHALPAVTKEASPWIRWLNRDELARVADPTIGARVPHTAVRVLSKALESGPVLLSIPQDGITEVQRNLHYRLFCLQCMRL